VLVPTRELAEQVLQSARTYGRHLEVSAAAIYGGVGMEPQTRALARGTDIVVATPGRLLDHMERGHVDFSRLEVLVLDEADRMLDMGFAPDVRRILRALPSKRQTMLFSATVSLEVDALARRALDSHASVEIGRRATRRRCRSRWTHSPAGRSTATPPSKSGGGRSPRKESST